MLSGSIICRRQLVGSAAVVCGGLLWGARGSATYVSQALKKVQREVVHEVVRKVLALQGWYYRRQHERKYRWEVVYFKVWEVHVVHARNWMEHVVGVMVCGAFKALSRVGV